MAHVPILQQIEALDPIVDHQRIVFLSTCYDFPFDTTRSLEFALFRTFAVPSISALLDRTGEFQNRAQKRYDDTDIIVSELMEHGYDSDRGKRALRRMNHLHGRFEIANSDYLYVLSTFIFEPIRWNERFGWRRMCDKERQAMFHFWREVGRRMNIRDIPTEYKSYEQFNTNFEAKQFHFAESNERVGRATRELFVSWGPWFAAPIIRSAIHALLDDPLRSAFGFPTAPTWIRWLVLGSLRGRAWLLRYLPNRRRPRLRTEMKRSLYPNGYQLETIGPPSVDQAT